MRKVKLQAQTSVDGFIAVKENVAKAWRLRKPLF
jgi:hypothetical protein